MDVQVELKRDVLQFYSEKIDFCSPSCSHSSRLTASRQGEEGETKIICEECYRKTAREDVQQSILKLPLSDSPCFCSSTLNVRLDPDLQIGVCDLCRAASKECEMKAEKERIPSSNEVPDCLVPGLYIGSKDSSYNIQTLRELGISRILVCCRFLPAYHPDDPSMQYHRLALDDSLAQNLSSMVPSALSFISQSLLKKEGVLVHCNAGVSRSGAIVVWFLRECARRKRKEGEGEGEEDWTVKDALSFAKSKRSKIFPNSYFQEQLSSAFNENK